jgi:selenocysteine-specific elongation factor
VQDDRVHVLATAGHVDHGKSTLVRALTGMEPDRWAEERRRGMTIDLGFAWAALGSGETVAFVDVPGHERFVPNMLAGVGPVPAVLVVVAADDGWSAQSEEHLQALDALGVRHGLLAVTRSDLADPAPALADARERVARATLGEVEAVAVSAQTGAGLDELRAALGRLVRRLPPPTTDGRVRLWVDRAFTIRGSGTVVTGTLGGGTLRAGDALELAPSGRAVRVRGLQSLGRPAEAVPAVARVAVNLRGVDLDDVHRGDALVTPGAWVTSRLVDVRLRGDDPADLPRELVLHVGSAAVAATVRPLGGDSARLTLGRSLPLQPGDVALLRDPGARRIAAGVTVLDPAPPALVRRGAARRRAEALAGAAAVDAAAEVTRRGMVTRAELAALGVLPAEAPPPAGAVAAGGVLVADEVWARWRGALERAVAVAQSQRPLDGGIPEESVRRLLGLPDPAVLDALVSACSRLERAGGKVRPAGWSGPEIPEAARRGLEALRARLQAEPFAAAEQAELEALGLTPPLLTALTRAGVLFRVAGVFLLPDAEEEAVRRLAAITQPFTVSQARQALGTSRRVALPLLEHLDSQRRTRRLDPSTRVVLR